MKKAFSSLLSTFILCAALFSALLPSAQAIETLDPDQLFYITGAVSKTTISQGDADSNGNYPLNYSATATLPTLLGEYITTYSQYATEFSFTAEVIMPEGMTPNKDSVQFDCAFGQIDSIDVAGRMMYINVVLKSGTTLQDYTYEQWVTPMKLNFTGVLSGDAFVPGQDIATSISVSGTVAGEYTFLGKLSINIHGVMDPANPSIITHMVSGGETHTEETPVPPTPPESVTIEVDPTENLPIPIPQEVVDALLETVPTPENSPHASGNAASAGSSASSSSAAASAAASGSNAENGNGLTSSSGSGVTSPGGAISDPITSAVVSGLQALGIRLGLVTLGSLLLCTLFAVIYTRRHDRHKH